MEGLNPNRSIESAKETVVTPPAVELLTDPDRARTVWPERIANNEQFVDQVKCRQLLNERLDTIIAQLPRPDINLSEAIAQEYLREEDVAALYDSLGELLENEDYQRAALYIPFEFMPDADWQPNMPTLRQAAARFTEAYRLAWHNLLTVHDVRANFVDGNVLEVESRTGDLPRVVKAAHLLPQLVQKGIIEVREIFAIMEKSADQTLKRSIADALPVLYDLNLIDENALARFQLPPAPSSAEDPAHMTEKRKAWLKREQQRQTIAAVSDTIASNIREHMLSTEVVTQHLTPDANPIDQQTYINGLCAAIETAASLDTNEARALYNTYQSALASLWKNRNSKEVSHSLARAFRRLHGLNIVSDEELQTLDLTMPALAGPFSSNLEHIKEEVGEIRTIIAAMTEDAETMKRLYPVILLFGSRLKGYGSEHSDLDTGVFIRPNVSLKDEESIRQLLANHFSASAIRGETIEFWLRQSPEGLAVRDDDHSSGSAIGESTWTHVLFGAAWEGDAKAIAKLREQLLVPYFYDDSETNEGRNKRRACLEELERDSLQYRLLHRGYEQFHPAYGGIDTPHADRIDGSSAFWDSGYRQTATKLFASRVFLPKITKP